jgi:nucleoside-diphosphate-sugar epimerase
MASDPSRTVFVVGATGTQGGPVARALLEAGYPVRAASRSPERAADLAAQGAEPVAVDLLDPDFVARAAAGTELAASNLRRSRCGLVGRIGISASGEHPRHHGRQDHRGAQRPYLAA